MTHTFIDKLFNGNKLRFNYSNSPNGICNMDIFLYPFKR